MGSFQIKYLGLVLYNHLPKRPTLLFYFWQVRAREVGLCIAEYAILMDSASVFIQDFKKICSNCLCWYKHCIWCQVLWRMQRQWIKFWVNEYLGNKHILQAAFSRDHSIRSQTLQHMTKHLGDEHNTSCWFEKWFNSWKGVGASWHWISALIVTKLRDVYMFIQTFKRQAAN